MSKFLKGVELFENETEEQGYFIPCLTGEGAPGLTQEGAVGSLYFDEINKNIYKCVGIDGNGYQWVKETVTTPGDIGAAPAGYGLGVRTPRHISSVEELDLITDSGWYSLLCHSGLYITPEYFFAYGWMRVDSYGEGMCAQTLRRIQSEEILMRQYTSTGGWGEWKRCDPSAFAPSGYGLGEAVSRAWSEIDSIISPGWYRFNGLPFDAFQYANMRVDAWDVNNLRQTMYPLMGTNAEMRREKINGVWQEWEWVNPPMVEGKVYRTTERSNGHPVYAHRMYCGAFPNSTYKTFDISWLGAKGIVRQNARMVSNGGGADSYTLPFFNGDGTCAYWINVRAINVYQGADNDASAYDGYVDIYFIKD